MPHHQHVPETYRLLAVFSGIPLPVMPALIAAGLRREGDSSAITDHHRALLRDLNEGSGRIRWVSWGPDGPGYVLTGFGEEAIDVYAARYGLLRPPRRGPPLGEIAALRLAELAAQCEAVQNPSQQEMPTE